MDWLILHNVAALTAYIRNYGILAPVITFILFTLQAIFPVFPYVILTAATGLLFGFKTGFLLSWSGALTGACIAFWLCRWLGSEWVIARFQSRFDFDLRGMDSRLAFWSIIIVRIVPVVPTPLINAAAALGGVSFATFFFASAIGKLPTALLYTGLGLSLFKIQDIKLTLTILGVILFLILAGRYLKQNQKVNPRS
ncbi:MAG: VTT domain-containing protein [Syntrophomonadaceae bacterium]|nr:VTT domain-containing protein [Syntrophomonadaceae bacterium]